MFNRLSIAIELGIVTARYLFSRSLIKAIYEAVRSGCLVDRSFSLQARLISKGVQGIFHEQVNVWRNPIAAKASISTRIMFLKLAESYSDGSTTGQSIQKAIQLSEVILGSVFDYSTIRQIAAFASRMGLYELKDGKPYFLYVLNPEMLIVLMKEGVSAVCMSYKHTRISSDGLARDTRRIERAVAGAATQLSQKRLLFWCDVIGRCPKDVAWAQQGVDPYLAMPVLRIVSEKLKGEIEDSFWMNIELVASKLRPGLITFDEDSCCLKPYRLDDLTLSTYFPPTNYMSFESTKLKLVRLICHPTLYYRRARFESDKLEFLKYAVQTAGLLQNSAVPMRFTADGFLKADNTWKDMASFSALCSIQMNYDVYDLSRPENEIIVAEGESWLGHETWFPFFGILEPNTRAWVNENMALRFFEVRILSHNDDEDKDVSKILCRVRPTLFWRGTVRLRVRGLRVYPGHVTGKVVSYRLASKEEEVLMSDGSSTVLDLHFN